MSGDPGAAKRTGRDSNFLMSAAGEDVGVVQRVEQHVAFVEMVDTGQCQGCGARLICQPKKDSPVTVRAANTISAKLGQKVYVNMIPGLLTKLTMIHYGLPILGFFVGVFGTWAMIHSFNAITGFGWESYATAAGAFFAGYYLMNRFLE